MDITDLSVRRRRFETFVAEVYEPLQRYLRRRIDPASADDVLGDTLLVMWRRVDDIPAEASLAWCYGVARGCLANRRRGADRHLKLVHRLAGERQPAPASDDPVLGEALGRLPEGDREVLRLWAWEVLPPREIAVVLGITPNAASIRLHRAMQKLKAELLRRKDNGSPGHPLKQQGEEVAP
ncbi:MAG: sigma-70 family RNA polymerase sigma factor [Actinobacteria bacterium]|nr:sigma-70 family RNA polymerase sigma factor [Actinomycetota bacterium]